MFIGVRGPTAVVPCCRPSSCHRLTGRSMLKAICAPWSFQTPQLLPRSCMKDLAQMLPQLHSRLHQAATPGKAVRKQSSRSQDGHAYLVQLFCPLVS